MNKEDGKNQDNLVTLAILTYTKAQILQNVLQTEGVEAIILNINQMLYIFQHQLLLH